MASVTTGFWWVKIDGDDDIAWVEDGWAHPTRDIHGSWNLAKGHTEARGRPMLVDVEWGPYLGKEPPRESQSAEQPVTTQD